MCKCTPENRTPFCGKINCEWPEPENKTGEMPKHLQDRMEELAVNLEARTAVQGLRECFRHGFQASKIKMFYFRTQMGSFV